MRGPEDDATYSPADGGEPEYQHNAFSLHNSGQAGGGILCLVAHVHS